MNHLVRAFLVRISFRQKLRASPQNNSRAQTGTISFCLVNIYYHARATPAPVQFLLDYFFAHLIFKMRRCHRASGVFRSKER